MPTVLEMAVEAEKRGLPINNRVKSFLSEARKRNLIDTPDQNSPTAISPHIPFGNDSGIGRDNTPSQSTPPQATSSFLNTVKEVAPEVIGGTIGSIKAAASRSPVGMVASGLGSVIGDEAKQILQLMGVIKSNEQVPTTVKDEFIRAGNAFLRGAVGEGVGRGLITAGQKILAPFAGKVKPIVKSISGTLSDITKKTGARILPAQISDSSFVNIIQNISESSLTGSGNILASKSVFNKQVGNLISGVIGRVKDVPNKDFAIALRKNLTDTLAALRKPLSDSYDDIGRRAEAIFKEQRRIVEKPILGQTGEPLRDATGKILTKTTLEKTGEKTIIGGAKIRIKGVKATLNELAETIKEIKGFGNTASGAKLATDINKVSDVISYNAAKEIRSTLRELGQSSPLIPKTARQISAAKKLEQSLTDAMSKGLKIFDRESGSNLSKTWELTNKKWRNVTSLFNDQTIEGLAKQAIDNPDKIASSIFIKDNTVNLAKIKKLIHVSELKTGKAIWKPMQQKFMDNLFLQAGKVETGTIPTELPLTFGEKLLDAMFGKSGVGLKTMRVAFGKEATKELELLATTMKLAQEKEAEGIGSMAIKLMQFSAGTGLIAGVVRGRPDLVVAGGSVLIAPGLTAKFLTSKFGLKFLTTGFKIPAGTAQAASFITRFTAKAKNMGLKVSAPPR